MGDHFHFIFRCLATFILAAWPNQSGRQLKLDVVFARRHSFNPEFSFLICDGIILGIFTFNRYCYVTDWDLPRIAFLPLMVALAHSSEDEAIRAAGRN